VAGLVPCAASGTMISLRAVSPRAVVVGADHRDAGEFSLRAGHRHQAHAGHAGDVFQYFLQVVQAGQQPLPGGFRRERMAREEVGQHRQRVAGARVVFHGA